MARIGSAGIPAWPGCLIVSGLVDNIRRQEGTYFPTAPFEATFEGHQCGDSSAAVGKCADESLDAVRSYARMFSGPASRCVRSPGKSGQQGDGGRRAI